MSDILSARTGLETWQATGIEKIDLEERMISSTGGGVQCYILEKHVRRSPRRVLSFSSFIQCVMWDAPKSFPKAMEGLLAILARLNSAARDWS